MNKTKVAVNINNTVEVTITEAGAAHLNGLRAAFHAKYPNLAIPLLHIPGHPYRAQLWSIMQEFGPATFMGGPVLFEKCAMLIEVEP